MAVTLAKPANVATVIDIRPVRPEEVRFTAKERKAVNELANSVERAARYVNPRAFTDYRAALADARRADVIGWNDADAKPFATFRTANAFCEGMECDGSASDKSINELAECSSTYARAFLAGRALRHTLARGGSFDVGHLFDAQAVAAAAVEARRDRWNSAWEATYPTARAA